MGSVTVSYPFDTVRRRLMMMSGEGDKMYRYGYKMSGYKHFQFKCNLDQRYDELVLNSFE